jgi:hypothetical protein
MNEIHENNCSVGTCAVCDLQLVAVIGKVNPMMPTVEQIRVLLAGKRPELPTVEQIRALLKGSR